MARPTRRRKHAQSVVMHHTPDDLGRHRRSTHPGMVYGEQNRRRCGRTGGAPASTGIYSSGHRLRGRLDQRRARSASSGASVRSSRALCHAEHWEQSAYRTAAGERDRKSTRLNSSHVEISYAVFCLKKKTNHEHSTLTKNTKTIKKRNGTKTATE